MSDMTMVIGNRNYSSWSLRAWLVLQASEAEFDEIVVPLGRPETEADIRSQSPNGLVPALHVGETVIWDSLAISEYLAERYPERKLWPADIGVRAVARSVVAEMHSGFTALRSKMPMNVRASYRGAGRDPAVDNEIERIASIWESCRTNFGAEGDLLFGHFTVADAFYAPIVSRFRTYGLNLGGLAGEYMKSVLALPAMRDWVTKAEAELWTVERYDQ